MSRMFSSRFWSQVSALSLAVGTLSLVGVEPMQAQEVQTRTLTVSGEGIVEVPTTLAQIGLGIEIQGTIAQEIQQEVARRSQALVELLRSRNVDKLQTTGIRLNPIYGTINNERRITGYSASNLVSFRIATDKAGAILDEAVATGATRIDRLSFVAADEAIAAAQQQALRAATEEARGQADVVLATLNLTRREIVRIQVNAATPPPQPFSARNEVLSLGDRAATTAVVGGEQQIRASVTLVISY